MGVFIFAAIGVCIATLILLLIQSGIFDKEEK